MRRFGRETFRITPERKARAFDFSHADRPRSSRLSVKDAQGQGRSGSTPRDDYARDAARRNGVRIGVSPRNPRDRRPNPAQRGAPPERRSRRRRGFCRMRPTTGLPRFQPSCPAPSLPHLVPNEHAENAGTRKRRNPEEASALDPVENSIRRLQPSGERKHRSFADGLMGRDRRFEAAVLARAL